MLKVFTTGEWVERKRNFPHGKLTQDACQGNTVYHPQQFTPRKVPKSIPRSVESKLVSSVVKHGFDVAAQKHSNRLDNIVGGRSNVGMRSSLATASSSSKTARFIRTQEDTDATLDSEKPLSPLPCNAFTAKGKGTRSLRRTLRTIRG